MFPLPPVVIQLFSRLTFLFPLSHHTYLFIYDDRLSTAVRINVVRRETFLSKYPSGSLHFLLALTRNNFLLCTLTLTLNAIIYSIPKIVIYIEYRFKREEKEKKKKQKEKEKTK